MLTLRLTLKLFGNAWRCQRKRMVLTVMAITWGTISIVLLLSFGEGLKRNLTKNQRGMGDGIADGFIRISVGIEHVDALRADLERGFSMV